MVMLFMDEHARSRLLLRGEVVTFRRYRHKEGFDWATDRRRGRKLCNINVKFLCEVCGVESLKPYVEECGFQSLWEWVAAIRRFVGEGEVRGYLYRVEKVR
jgi:hypothetical protein